VSLSGSVGGGSVSYLSYGVDVWGIGLVLDFGI
jgi:hypothetical protein